MRPYFDSTSWPVKGNRTRPQRCDAMTPTSSRSVSTKRWAAVSAAALGLALLATAPARAEPKLLGNFEMWDAYRTSQGGGVVCYAVAEPKTKLPAGAKRDPIFMVISTWPGQSVANQPNIQIGYPIKDGSSVVVQVGAESFEFFAQGDNAWLKSDADEARFIQAARQGAEAQVKGTSRRGTETTDSYSLKGLAAALDKVSQNCK